MDWRRMTLERETSCEAAAVFPLRARIIVNQGRQEEANEKQ